jgi:DNA polymerase-3 subunit epsilon
MLYSIIDVETTGGSPKSSKITEIAIYNFDGEKIVDEFVTLINPECDIPEFIVRLTGISNKMVENAPKFYEIAKKVIEMTADSTFVAHNVGFDYGMIRQEFKRLGFDYRRPHLCTVKAARIIIPGKESYSLGKLTRALDIKLEGRHRAGGDALATVELFKIILSKDFNQLKNFIHQELNPQILHPNLDLNALEEIPNKTGVYKLYNELNQLLYIGKSKHIKTRIEQHLKNQKTAKGIKMSQEVSRIEYELTGSEIIALLLESNLVKSHKPIYNRQLRKSKFPYGIFDYIDDNGYLRLKLLLISKTTAQAIAVFSTREEAKRFLETNTEKFELCQKLTDLYQNNSACFQFQIKQCKGACVGQESFEAYNSRVQQFIDQQMLEGENFFIIDKGRDKTEKSLILIQEGRYAGYGFAPYHFNNLPPFRWLRFIQTELENKDSRLIIKHALDTQTQIQKVTF